jgi:hypothetical protein
VFGTGKHTKRSKWTRLLFAASSVATLSAAATLAAVASFGLFSTTSHDQTGQFSTGSVTLGGAVSGSCTVSNLKPGESSTGYGSGTESDTPCTLTVNYTGTVSGWLGLDISIASTSAGTDPNGVLTGGAGLYDSTSNGLQLLVTDNQSSPVTYMSGTTLGGSSTTGANPNATDLLVNTASFSNGQSVTFTINYMMPTTTTNAYEGAASSITMLAHSVQASNNNSTSSCTVGVACTSVNWS